MKQHITKEQLNELTLEQKERLREWWIPQAGDLYLDEAWWHRPYYKTFRWKKESEYEEVACYGSDECSGIPNLKEENKDQERSLRFAEKRNPKNPIYDPYYHRSYPLLSVGQMLEFLNEHYVGLEVACSHDKGRLSMFLTNCTWLVKAQFFKEKFEEQTYFLQGLRNRGRDSLCDALWKAVKEVLK